MTKGCKSTRGVISSSIRDDHFGNVVLTKDTPECFDSLFRAVIYELTNNYKFAKSIRDDEVRFALEFKYVCGDSVPWCTWNWWGGDIFSWLFVLILLTSLTRFNHIGNIFADARPKYAHSSSENCLSLAQVRCMQLGKRYLSV